MLLLVQCRAHASIVDGVAFSSLATFNQDPAGIRSLLIRLALWGNMSSTTALIHAMLAVSSLHRHGLQSQAVQLKIRALRSLGASIGNNLDPREAAQHIATGLLLCSFEVTKKSLSVNPTWTDVQRT